MTDFRIYSTALSAISIHTLLAESDRIVFRNALAVSIISIHTLLAESDSHVGNHTVYLIDFNPHPPRGE